MADLKHLVYENNIITVPNVTNKLDEKGIGHAYFRSMTEHKNKIFQIDGITNEEETFGVVLQRCVRTALKMQSLGVTTDDIITVCSLNNFNCCVPFIAGTFLGAMSANLDPLFAVTDTVHYLKILDPKLIFVEENAVNYVETVLKASGRTSKIVVFGPSDKYMSFYEFIEPVEDENKFVPVDVDSMKTAILLFSSGSTGLPKVICISHHAHMTHAKTITELETSYDRMLSSNRLYSGSTILFLSASILTGVSRIIVPQFDAELVVDVIKRLKPKILFVTPYQMLTLCDALNVSDVDVECLEQIFLTGAVVFKHQIEFFRKTFPYSTIKRSYGLSEAGAVTYCTSRTKEEHDLLISKSDTIGSVVNGFTYKVVGIDSREILGPYSNGELLIKSESLLSGYYKSDSSDVWDSDGWFKTGDIVYYDDDFFFYFVDRIKQLMKYRSMHVVPTFIENVLSTHPKVKKVYVVSKFHEMDGDLATAVVQLHDSCHIEGIENELYDFVAENLEDKYKLRGGVKIVKKFPVASTGKVDLVKLRHLIQSNQI